MILSLLYTAGVRHENVIVHVVPRPATNSQSRVFYDVEFRLRNYRSFRPDRYFSFRISATGSNNESHDPVASVSDRLQLQLVLEVTNNP